MANIPYFTKTEKNYFFPLGAYNHSSKNGHFYIKYFITSVSGSLRNHGPSKVCSHVFNLHSAHTTATATTYNSDVQNIHDAEGASKVIAIPNQFNGDLEALDEKVTLMMEKSPNMIQIGKYANGTPKQETPYRCQVCGKEGMKTNIRDHIEANHLVGVSIPCKCCDKTFSTVSLRMHKKRGCTQQNFINEW